MKGIDKALTVRLKWLVQEVDGSGIQHARPDGFVWIGRHENDRYVKTKRGQMTLELDTAHLRHLHIQYQAFGFRHR